MTDIYLATRLVMTVRPVRTEQFGSDLMAFHEIWYLAIFRNYSEKIKVIYTNTKMYRFDHISLNSS